MTPRCTCTKLLRPWTLATRAPLAPHELRHQHHHQYHMHIHAERIGSMSFTRSRGLRSCGAWHAAWPWNGMGYGVIGFSVRSQLHHLPSMPSRPAGQQAMQAMQPSSWVRDARGYHATDRGLHVCTLVRWHVWIESNCLEWRNVAVLPCDHGAGSLTPCSPCSCCASSVITRGWLQRAPRRARHILPSPASTQPSSVSILCIFIVINIGSMNPTSPATLLLPATTSSHPT
jgi:hypothetical protein